MRLLREHIIIFFQHLRQWSPGISLVLIHTNLFRTIVHAPPALYGSRVYISSPFFHFIDTSQIPLESHTLNSSLVLKLSSL